MNFLIQCPHPWRGIAQRPHHLARRFAKAGHPVHWVEPRYLRWLAGKTGEFFRSRREQPAPNITIHPMTFINGEQLGFIKAHNRHWMARAMKSGLKTAGEKTVLWLYDPHHGYLADRVPHDLLVYDIMDEFSGFPWSPPEIAQEEAELLKRADWVFAGTGALFDAKQTIADGRISLELSGVDAALFSAPMPDKFTDDAHRELRKRYRKLAGYAGMIDLRVDMELLANAAKALPDWGFAMIGPGRTETATAADMPNIHFLGPREYTSLPAYYQQWDAALLPFVENNLTRHINPTKILEYAAAGVPVVARALPDVEKYYSGGAALYRDANGFIEAMKSIDGNSNVVGQRKQIARGWAADRDWDRIAERMLEKAEGLLHEPR